MVSAILRRQFEKTYARNSRTLINSLNRMTKEHWRKVHISSPGKSLENPAVEILLEECPLVDM